MITFAVSPPDVSRHKLPACTAAGRADPEYMPPHDAAIMVAIDLNALFTPLGAMPSAMLVLPPALVGNVVFDESVVALLISEGKIAAIQAPLRLEMDRLVSELTVAEFIGVMAICLGMFYVVGILIRVYDHHWPAGAKIQYWGGIAALLGLPLYLGFTVLWPQLPVF